MNSEPRPRTTSDAMKSLAETAETGRLVRHVREIVGDDRNVLSAQGYGLVTRVETADGVVLQLGQATTHRTMQEIRSEALRATGRRGLRGSSFLYSEYDWNAHHCRLSYKIDGHTIQDVRVSPRTDVVEESRTFWRRLLRDLGEVQRQIDEEKSYV